jgi:Tfp pilus assembly protein PilV
MHESGKQQAACEIGEDSIRPACRGDGAGFSLIETVTAMIVVVIGFAALYALCSQCLRVLSCGRQTIAAKQSVQDRTEQLRSSSWTQLTNPTYVQGCMSIPTDSGASLQNASESVTISVYPPPAAPAPAPIQVARAAGATQATISGPNPNSAVATADMVQIDLRLSWTRSPGAQAQSRSASTIVAKNTNP